jgi:hypothetical protein
MILPKSMALLHFITLMSEEFDAITSPFSQSGTSLKYHMRNLPIDDQTVKKGPNGLPRSTTYNLL